MASTKSTMSPLMQQYYQIKAQHPDCVMFFRVGDFYETFGEDAIITSKVLGLVLTRKASGGGAFTELAGVPHHAIDVYLPKMVKAGYKVAVCDQLEDPKLTKTLVKRGITELVTPGVSFNDGLLTGGENNWLAACYFEQHKAGVAFLDISTGTFKVAEGDRQYIDILLSDFAPKEVLLQQDIIRNSDSEFAPLVEHLRHSRTCITPMQEWAFSYSSARARLLAQFKTSSLKGFGIEELQFATVAASAILSYLELTEHTSLDHIRSISRIDRDNFVWIDRFTFRNLEIFAPLVQEGTSLLQVMDRNCSPMGSRLLREWIAMPLKDTAAIARRQDVVESLHDNPDTLSAVREALADVGDLERMISKAAVGRISPREVLALCNGLRRIAEITELTSQLEKVAALSSGMDGCSALCDLIEKTVTPQAAAQLGKGDVIAEGVDEELDNYRNTLSHSKEILLDIQQTERERTGISSLKISYNNVFGYYLEVRNTHADKVPDDWIRKQTLVNAERYITPQLKEYEQTIMGAEERILAIETRIYGELVAQIQQNVAAIQRDAQLVAQIDCLASFAFLAAENNYCRPVVDNSLDIDIKAGRHPVIETMMEPGSEYVANDLAMSNDGRQIIILTGPNMSGKSALLRQTALIMLMAQVGSFVPAASARLGYIDKL
ncbi:MAG: DNA mismatch repair protein MutS, partial [Bacteroidales bacterium]|nr:DNA mismatch repair protein MutS [Bacteroidales bacterium]